MKPFTGICCALFLALVAVACGDNAGSISSSTGTSANAITVAVSGIVDTTALNKSSRRLAASSRSPIGAGITVQAINGAGVVAGTAQTDAGGAYSFSLPHNATYIIRITNGNVVMKSLAILGTGAKTVNVNPSSTAIIIMLGNKLGMANFGDGGAGFSIQIATIDMGQSVTAISAHSKFSALLASVMASIAAGANPFSDSAVAAASANWTLTLPTTFSHGEFSVSPVHSAFRCVDCHTGAEAGKVCAQSGCHPFSKYAALMTNYNHTTGNTGDQCDKCHKSIEVNKAGETTKVAGWRRNNRVSHALWHTAVSGVCLDCHEIANIATYPASHVGNAARQGGCEGCHHYNLKGDGAADWGGGHPSVTSGCRATGCHTGHNSPTGCESCHQASIANGYTSWAGGLGHPSATSGCRTAACHTHSKPASHYDSKPGGPYECEWCHSGAASNGYTTWNNTYRHGSVSTAACKSCHPNGAPHRLVTSGCRASGCHTGHKSPAGCETCHQSSISNGYTSWNGGGDGGGGGGHGD